MAAGCMLVTGNEKFYRQCVMPTVRLLDAETAHVFAVRLAKYGIVPLMNRDDIPSLVSKFGLINSIGTYIFSDWNFIDEYRCIYQIYIFDCGLTDNQNAFQ